MGRRVRVARLSDLTPGRGTLVSVEGRDVALFLVGDAVYAIGAVCPHEDGPLQDGELDGLTVYCPWHAYDFDLRTGACAAAPHLHAATYPVCVEGEEICLEVPD